MSNSKNEITENINSQPQIRIQSFKNNNISQLSEKTKQIKVKNKYQYNYSNKNVNTKNNKLSNISKINIKCIKSKNISISPHKKNNISSSKLNCETNYSINKINNTCYVNGLNKNISKINSARSPDLRFIPYENKEIYEKKKYIYDLKNTNFNTNYNRNSRLNKNRKEKKIINNTNVTNIKYDKYFTEKDSNLNMNTYLIENNNTIVKSSKKNNHSFRSISNCSKDNRSQSNPRKTSNERKYKCDIRIHNEYNNTSKENIRPFSFDNKNKKRKIKNTKELFITDNSRINNNLEYELNRNKSFDGKCLKMQNSQNLQILQEEKLYQILIPIPPNETDHACHFQISPVKKKEKEKENKNIIEESEIITRKIFKKNIKQGKKTSWIKSTSPKKENSENLSKNSEESNRKFKGQMQIEKNALNFKRTPRNWNSQLKNEHQFSIEKKKEKEKILSPTKAEKISIEGIKKFNDLIIKNENNKFEIKSNVNKEEEEKEEKNIINDEEIGREIKRNVKVITQETKNGVENSESSSDYDALKQITNLNNIRYENIIKNSFEQNPNQRKVIINNIRRYYPYSNINKNNEIQINESLEIRNRNINYLSEFPDPELVMNPLYEENKLNEGTQYNYRQSITNKEQNESSKEHILEEENDILDSPTDTKVNHERKSTNLEESQSQGQTDVPSPKSQLREEFREEIISLSPRHMNNIEQINKMKEINYMEEEYKIYTSNMRQSEQLIENAEEQEQDELSQKERESNINFSFKMNMNNNNNKYHLPKPKYQYICKTKSNKANKNKNNKYENRTVMTQVIDNNSIIKNSGIIMQNINNDNKYRYVNNNNIPNNIDENMGNLNMIYNSQKIQKNNDNSNLNEITFQRSNGLSKSQLLKKENNNFNTKINLGNICFNNTLKRPSKTEIKNDNINNESNLIHHYEAKKEGNNISENEFNQNKNNKVKIIKK